MIKNNTEIPIAIWQLIVTWVEQGESWAEIRHWLYHNVYQHYAASHVLTSASCSGRPPKLSQWDHTALVHELKQNWCVPLAEITNLFNQGQPSLADHISTKTVQQALHDAGYYARVGVQKHWVNETNQRKHFAFTKAVASYMDYNWQSIIWSDESQFTLWLSDGPVHVWCQPNEKYDVSCLVRSAPSHCKGIMLWGCFCYDQLGPLVVVERMITAQKYIETLEEYLLPFQQKYAAYRWPTIFQHNNVTSSQSS